ncbi:MAG: DUF58 domain-containing protein [Chthoniobacteraceae bacterium]
MIAPLPRLLLAVTVIVLPFAGLAVALPSWTIPGALVVAVFFLVVALDAWCGRRSRHGIAVQLPELVRLQKSRPAALELLVRNPSRQPRLVRLGLPFPREIESTAQEMTVALPASAEFARFTWPCTLLARGRYWLHACYLETPSPLGFWAVRTQHPTASELRVYPDLFDERKRVAALFLHRGHLGIHARRQSGRGREFEKLREYIPGDGYDEIHWKATARRGHPVTKVFQIERTQEIYVLIDSSRLSARAQVLERAITASLMLAVAAEQQGDLFGLVTFDSTVRKFIRAKSGQAHFDACRDSLYTLESSPVSPDFEEVCTFIRTRLRKRALLVFLTALDDPILAESFTKSMDLIARQHLILVNMARPVGVQPVFTAPTSSLGALYENLGGHLQWRQLHELEVVLRRHNVAFHLLESDHLSAQLVTQYLNIKSRQLL